jgi:ATP-binding cassette, subfamily F, member 3
MFLQAQQKKRDHMQAFVDKFRYNAKRAQMAQSRIKALKRMELLDDVISDPTFRFEFPDPQPLQTPILAVNDLKFKYEGTGFLKKVVDLSVLIQPSP